MLVGCVSSALCYACRLSNFGLRYACRLCEFCLAFCLSRESMYWSWLSCYSITLDVLHTVMMLYYTSRTPVDDGLIVARYGSITVSIVKPCW